ncbi:putative RNA-directed DNA polymerase, eukaryota, reverse transcriptase zinc-binding domain protein [Tanacetum coccineum]
MKILSINSRGFASSDKQDWIRDTIRLEHIGIVGIQETKMGVINSSLIYQVWGNIDVDFCYSEANGQSGGVSGRWVGSSNLLVVVNVYGPQAAVDKENLWKNLLHLKSSVEGSWIFFEDFNTVRDPSECSGSCFCDSEALAFNNFIAQAGLHDFQMGGRRFTYFNRAGSKMSKLDRFLVSDCFFDSWTNVVVTVLERVISDHSPILLTAGAEVNFGPKPFRVFDAWSKVDGFDAVRKSEIRDRIKDWDEKAEARMVTPEDVVFRDNLLAELYIIDQIDRDILRQQSRIRWAVKGDENSRFFHSSIKNNMRNNSINGLLCNGRFSTLSPTESSFLDADFTINEIKEAVWSCAGSRAPGPDGLNFNFIKRYWDNLETDFVRSIKHFESTGRFSRGCNSSFFSLIPKINDPISISDYRPISLIGCTYKVIAKLLASRLATVIHKIISPNQTAFIKGRQILDEVLVANEVIDYAQLTDLKLLLFKVDFAKAFDNVRWEFLLDVINQMGFSSKLLNWIRGCLISASISILVNGSPTIEFHMENGLRQGDPLSPFLFIIVAEALQVTMLEAYEKVIFKSLSLHGDNTNLSLL